MYCIREVFIFYRSTVSLYLGFPDFKEENSGKFYVEAENACGITRSNEFAIKLKRLPQPGFSPTVDTICYRSSRLINATFNGNLADSLIYQWYRNDVSLPGESGSSIFPVFGAAGIYSFSIKAANSCGSVTSLVTTAYVNRIVPQFVVDSAGCNNELSVSIQNRTSRAYYPLLSWKVLYDDGLEDQLTSPTDFVYHKYKTPGYFDLRLLATDSAGCSSDTLHFTLNNYAPARADFMVTDTCLGSKTVFTNLAQKGAGSYGYDLIRWETADQVIMDTSASVTLQYQQPGIYRVVMYVRGKNSCITDKVEKQVVIAGNPVFAIDSTGGCKNELGVTVTRTGPDHPVRNFLWNIDYGDGTRKLNMDSSFLTDNHRYNKTGTCTVRINTSGSLGCQHTVLEKQVINYGLTRAGFSVKDTCLGYPSIFMNTAVKGYLNDRFGSVTWKVDGQLLEDSSSHLIYRFNKAGSYSVTQYVIGENNCLADSITRQLHMVENPVFVLDSSGSCAGKLMVTVNNASSHASIKNHFWEVDYGDGHRKILLDSLLKTDSHTYRSPGNYLVKVNSSGNLACQTQTLTGTFTNFAVAKADFSVGDTCLGMPSFFRNTTVRGFGNTGYVFARWQIDGKPVEDTAPTVRYTYAAPGTHRVSLAVLGNNSCIVDSISKQLVVVGYPVASFLYKDSCAGFDVLFRDASKTSVNDKIAQWQWNFADRGTASFAQNPVRIFARDGAYSVNLLVQSASCPQFYDDTTITINIIRPRPDLRYNPLYAVKNRQTVLDAYPNGRSYEWVPNFNLNNTRIRQPLINADFTAREYRVHITDASGCINVDTLQVWGFHQPDVHLPTAFSPNHDGYNDVYKAEYVMIDHLEYLKVLDKFNNVIFETKSITDTWDGTYKGRPIATGQYLVLVSAVDKLNQRIQKKVTVTLLR